MVTAALQPNWQKSVDYAVIAELGIGWKKTSAKGNESVSMKIDSSFLPNGPINCALVKQTDGCASRQTEGRKPKAAQADEQTAA